VVSDLPEPLVDDVEVVEEQLLAERDLALGRRSRPLLGRPLFRWAAAGLSACCSKARCQRARR
jgi:hypothetical protein